MNEVPGIVCGIMIFGTFYVWKKLSISWNDWFPLLTKLAKLGLWVCLLFALLFTIQFAMSSPSSLEWLGFLLGSAAPSLIFGKSLLKFSPKEKHERGAVIATPLMVNTAVRTRGKRCDFKLAGVSFPKDAEPYHLLITGSTGSGKSVAITTLLDAIHERGDVAVIVDSGGDYLKRYYDPSVDVVINPFDERCVAWNPLNDLQGPWDAEALAKSIVPSGSGEQDEWNGYTQTFIHSVIKGMSNRGETDFGRFLYYVQEASIPELEVLLTGTPAKSQLFSEKMVGSVRTIATKYLSPYNYLDVEGEPFSMSQFIRSTDTGGGKFAYLTYRDDQLDILKNLIACILDITARTILSMEPKSDRRVWLVIDEFASLGKIQSIEAIATKARKVGGCLVVGIQSVSQLKNAYGEHGAQTLLSCLSSCLFLRASDGESAEYISRYLGEAQTVRTTRGVSSSEQGQSASWNEQTAVQRLVLPSELQNLSNCVGYLKLAGDFPVCKVTLDFPKKYNDNAKAFIPRTQQRKPVSAPVSQESSVAVEAENEKPQVSKPAVALADVLNYRKPPKGKD